MFLIELIKKYTMVVKTYMKFKNSSNIIYQYTADRLKRRREVLKLTNDVIAKKKIFVFEEAYNDWATDEDEPEKFVAKPNFQKSKYDSAIISRILNNERGKIGKRNSPNPYLIPPAYENLLVEQLQLDNKTELFWGTESEQEAIVKSFYLKLFEDILDGEQSDLKDLLNLYISDYVPYSKDLAYHNMIVEKCLEQSEILANQFPLYGTENVRDKMKYLLQLEYEQLLQYYEEGNPIIISICATIDFIMDMIGQKDEESDVDTVLMFFEQLNDGWFRKEAMGRIIFLNFDNLFRLYKKYFLQQSNFKNLEKKISEFVSDILTPYFIELLGNQKEFKTYSLGYRVRTIIETDVLSIFSYISKITKQQYNDVNNKNSKIYKRLLQSTLNYISDLKYMQWLTDREMIDESLHEDIERFYLQTSDVKQLHDKWETQYNDYLFNCNFEEYGDYLEADEYEELVEGYDDSDVC